MERRPGDVGYWEDAYVRADAGWDLGVPAPPIVSLVDGRRDLVRPGRALVVGCGRGHDALALASRGFSVIALDWSPSAAREARARLTGEAGPPRVLRGDVRRLPVATASVDHVVEHTCFCALDPADRPLYVREVARVLRPGGLLFGLFYEPAAPQNPPFTTSEAELRGLFGAAFDLAVLERARDSIERRAGRELLAAFVRRNATG